MSVLDAENISKTIDNTTILSNFSFSVEKGEVLGLIGPNGAGKTTTLRLCCGLTQPTTGKVSIHGNDALKSDTKQEIGFLPEESPVYERMTASQYLSFFANVYGISQEKRKEVQEDVFSSLDLNPEGKRLGNMSKGMKRKVVITRSLIHSPDLLIFDEPASGLDPVTKKSILSLLERIIEKRDVAVIFSSHDLYHVQEISDKVLALQDGEPIYYGGTEEFINNNDNLDTAFHNLINS